MALVLALVFTGTLLLVIATYSFVNRKRLANADVLRDRLTPLIGVPAGAVRILREERASQLELLNRLLSGKPFTARITQQLEQAGSKQTVGGFVLTCAICAVVAGYIGLQMGPALGLLLAAGGAAIPFMNLGRKRAKRIKTFEAQLPEAIDMLVNAMKAGYSLQAAMKFIGDEMNDPLGPEFTRFYDEQRLGMDVRLALQGMQERVDTLDLRMFITSLLIQRETGGNLAEVMTNLSSLMRDRVGIRGQIDTLTAEPRLSALVLALLPVFLLFLFSVLNRSYMLPLYTTSAGHLMLMYAGISDTVGYLILRKMGNIDI
jgi:tight adherence protein B